MWYVKTTLRESFPLKIPPEKRFVASLYSVYLDESGTHASSDYAVVAGFVSNVSQWEAFSEKWQQALTDFHLDYFHMTDFENRRGQFDNWSTTAKKDLLNRLLPIIDEHTFSSIGCIVRRESFDTLLSPFVKQLCGDAYGVAALACWRHLGEMLKGVDGWMDCTMERGARGCGALQLIHAEDSKFPEWHYNHRILGLSFRDKRVFLPLQAADILAYELWKQSARQFGQETRPPRYPLKVIGQKKHQWHYFQEKHLRELNEDVTRQLLERLG